LFVTGLVMSGGKKMSKTLGNIIDPEELLQEYGTDAVRYFLARHISPFEDGDITREHFKEAYNADLANGLGNLVARIMKLAEDNLEKGTRPEPEDFPKEYTDALEHFEVNKAADVIWERIKLLDQQITDTAPFKVIKTNPEEGKELIAALTEELYLIGRMLNPLMPRTSKLIKDAIISNKKPDNLFARKE
jgi:methionyl-tRNA synthetase